MRLFYFLQQNKKRRGGSKERKERKYKDLAKNIDFKSVFKNFSLSYFVYSSFILAMLSTFPDKISLPQDYLLFFLPLPIYLMITAILVEIDDRRTLSNYYLQDEIKRIKNQFLVRKKTEEIFDRI
jgi:hypothetical protein